MENSSYAYIRVSSKEQNEARQIKEVRKLGIKKSNIIIEKSSGKSFNRSKYKQLLKLLRKGDMLYIHSIDRLGRDYIGIINEWNHLSKEMKVFIKVMDMPILDTDRPAGSLLNRFLCDITLLTLAFQAEQECQNIRSRQKAGIAIAKETGKHLGRPKVTRTKTEKRVVKQYLSHDIDLITALSLLNIKKSTFYKLCKILANKK